MPRRIRVLAIGTTVLAAVLGGVGVGHLSGVIGGASRAPLPLHGAPLQGGLALAPADPVVTRPKSNHTSAAPDPTAAPIPAHTPSPKPTVTKPAAPSSLTDQLLAQINTLRAAHGAKPLTIKSGLQKSAHLHNLMMIDGCGLSHQCPGEADLGTRITAQGVHWSACGENIGESGPHPNTTAALLSAAEGLTMAMYNEKPPDDGHRRNILSTSYRYIGIDVVRDSHGTIWLTQDFAG